MQRENAYNPYIDSYSFQLYSIQYNILPGEPFVSKKVGRRS